MSASLEKQYSSLPVSTPPLVKIDGLTPALEVFKILTEKNILSAPVFEGDNCIGLIDLVDLCAYALDVHNQLSSAPSAQDEDKHTWRVIFDAALKLKQAKDLVNFSKTNYSYPLSQSATLKEILESLSCRGVHRVPLLDAQDKVTRLVTQSEVLRFVSQHLDDFGPALDRSVLMASLVGKSTVYVLETQPVIDAFKAIIKRKVSAVAVLGSDGKLIGNISVRDLRHVLKDKIDLQLQKPIRQFLEEIHASHPTLVAVSVLNGDSVRSAITRMTSNGIHRVYVIDAHQQVQGVISITDIFGYLLKALYQTEPTPKPHVAIEEKKPQTIEEAQKKVGVDSSKPLPKEHKLSILDNAFQILFPTATSDDSIFTVLGDAPAGEVVTKLRQHKVMCLPVLDPVKHDDGKIRVEGLVDVADVAAFVIDFEKTYNAKEKVVFEEMYANRLKGYSAKDLINFNGSNHCAILGHQTRLLDVLLALTIPGVHRVPVLTSRSESNTTLGRFVTQTQILKFIATHLDQFSSVLNRNIIAARCGVFQPKYVQVSKTALEGFQVLYNNKVSGLPVVNDKFEVVGSLSTTDLRLVVTNNPTVNLNKPIPEFWEDVQGDETYQHPSRVVTCSYTDTVHHVITKLHSNQVHRLFIVSENNSLLGIVSLSDVLKYILRAGAKI